METRIALGLGDNIDYEIEWDSAVFERLIVEREIRAAELERELPVSDVRSLIISILSFLKRGTGGERYVASPGIIEEFAALFRKNITLGGTSVRAAAAMHMLGHRCALHLVTMNDDVRRLLPPDSAWTCSNSCDSLYPHLIVQFVSGTRVCAGDITISAARANRIIYDNDPDNCNLKLNGEFAALIGNARVFLISGFNAMRDPALLADRLRTLRAMMTALPRECTVFYEDACFHQTGLSTQVRDALIDVVRIHSLNEDELQGYLGRQVALFDVADVLDALRTLHRMIPVPTLVVHTQRWAIASGDMVRRYERALRGGVDMATARLRFGDRFGRRELEETALLPVQSRAAQFSSAVRKRAGESVICLPSYVVPERELTTIGLGDAFVGGFLPGLIEDED